MSSKKTAREQVRAERAQQAETARRRDNVMRVSIGVAVVLIVVIIFGLVQWQRSQIDTTASFPAAVAAGADAKSGAEPGMGDGVGTGEADAPVTVELFEDFSCPHCAEFEAEAPELLDPYVEAGDVRIVYYPMTLSPFTRAGTGNETAANAFGCAADEENSKAADYHGTLFANPQNQQNWTESVLIDLAKQTGIDSEKFDACVKNNSFEEWVRSIDQTATDRGVSGTPTAFVNGDQIQYRTMTELVEGIRTAIEKGLE